MSKGGVLNREPDLTYLGYLGITDLALDRAQVSVPFCIAAFLHEIAYPAIMAGQTIGRKTYNAHRALTMHENLFVDEPITLNDPGSAEDVIVAIQSEGAVTNFTTSPPNQDDSAIIRVLIRSPGRSPAMDLAWGLHRLFRKRPAIQREVTVRSGSSDEGKRVDLLLQETHPLDDPSYAERSSDMVVVSFRVNVRYSRT